MLIIVSALGTLIANWRPGPNGAPLLVSLAIVPGALWTAALVPRVWPAASRLTRRSVATSAGLGALTFQVLAVMLHRSGLAPDQGSADPFAELAVLLVGTAVGALVAWHVFRGANRGEWVDRNSGDAG
jgi:hypothetical protein